MRSNLKCSYYEKTLNQEEKRKRVKRMELIHLIIISQKSNQNLQKRKSKNKIVFGSPSPQDQDTTIHQVFNHQLLFLRRQTDSNSALLIEIIMH
ncbi:hypothetical protein TTHERM_00780690 (macronuclear) [Tetrahymena thermophila SB210]|uniref:Uncharacterized protein n=1 Tax=Tetrahymena thermophila (strain SB210) TaxID=312017 RepID=I7MJ83_TETTS|nr:hypothetical protein TTHERM_00780690 [Tetrahymena thermophila SB210]EAS05980.1 hypothetical protein TTHERM_00780690 [Tetrahymena thermophila SB210]|eukprot:XP_001026225.1 hypothetical protein TTHERM_00780690 [Tetrahymena thermophila SB210]